MAGIQKVIDDQLLPSRWFLFGAAVMALLATLIAFQFTWTGTWPSIQLAYGLTTFSLPNWFPFHFTFPTPYATVKNLVLAFPIGFQVNIYAIGLYFWPIWIIGLGYNKQAPYRPDNKTPG